MGLRVRLVIASIVLSLAGGAAQAERGATFLQIVENRDGKRLVELLDSRLPEGFINARQPGSGDGALHILTRDRDFRWLALILGKGARPDTLNNRGETALLLASRAGWQEGAALLVQRGAKVDLPDSWGVTPLIAATKAADPEIIRLLVSKGADPRRRDQHGKSALDYARELRNPAVTAALASSKP